MMKDTKKERVDIALDVELDDGLMKVTVDGVEIKTMLLCEITNSMLEQWQEKACYIGALTIENLRDEVKRLRGLLFDIQKLDAEKDGSECNEWGEAHCFNLAQEIAKNAIKSYSIKV